MHTCHMIIDLQFGSTGKGLLAGYMAKRNGYDTAICAFATNAGHTYIDKSRNLEVMTQQLPTAITSPTVKNIILGPGALIHPQTLRNELDRYADLMKGKRLIIHPHAAIVEDYHADLEIEWGMSKMGSTTKGVGAAAIERIRRTPKKRPWEDGANVAKERLFSKTNVPLGLYNCVVSPEEYASIVESAERVLIEGAQGFSLSMYHGDYPYTTSRDVTPWQIAADCGLPFKWAPYIKIYGTARTYPIRVNNRDGYSGDGYSGQREVSWESLNLKPELTTVTKLPRRIFEFSEAQMVDAAWHCGGYWETNVFLNFANYCEGDLSKLQKIIRQIETPQAGMMNPPRVHLLGWGPDDADVRLRAEFDLRCGADTEGGSTD